jgi:hypothetical protein
VIKHVVAQDVERGREHCDVLGRYSMVQVFWDLMSGMGQGIFLQQSYEEVVLIRFLLIFSHL